MNTEIEPVKPLTDNEIRQLQAIADAGHEVKLGNRELRAFLATISTARSGSGRIARVEGWLSRLCQIIRANRPDLAYSLSQEIEREVIRG